MANDISIQNISSVDPRVQIRTGPVYLISLDEKASKKNFIAIKLDELSNCIKVVGFFHSEKLSQPYDKIMSNYQEIVKKMQTERPDEIVEIMFPWRIINSIQSLVYKHKGIK